MGAQDSGEVKRRRLAGQDLACGWCGEPVTVKSRGPVPKWCGATCRQRAWEMSQAAAAGKAAVAIVDREVLVIPADGPGWVVQLDLLADQLSQGPKVVADQDLEEVTAAVNRLGEALTRRQRWRGRFEPWA